MLTYQSAIQRPDLPESHYLDNRIYTDPEIFEEERQRVFGRVWNLVCLESEVSSPGDFRTVSVAGWPVVIVRGQDGRLRAFYNICRHRCMRVVREEAGNAKAFQCIYHLWTYGLDGSLLGVTFPEGYERTGLRKEEFGLVEVRLETVGGLVFVCLSDETEPLRDYLGDNLIEHIEHTLGSVELEVFHFHKQLLRANWKLFMDNNSEAYHTVLHSFNRATFSQGLWTTGRKLYLNGHTFRAPSAGAPVIYEAVNLEKRESHSFPGVKANEFWHMNLFPDVMLNLRGTALRIDRMVPLSPGETMLEFRGVGIKGDPPEVRAMRVRHHNQVWGPMGRNLPEDIIAVEEQWEKMRAGAIPYSIIAREHELLDDGRVQNLDDENVRHFYRTWGQFMGRRPHDPFGEA